MSSYFESLKQAMTATPAWDGESANLVHLTNAHGMSVTLMDIGATWLSCQLPLNGQRREVLLRAYDMAAHQAQTAYLGAIVGRFANRIAHGRFTLDGHDYQIDTQQSGENHESDDNNGEHALHGGEEGFDRRRWQMTQPHAQQVVFTLQSTAGDQGFPGNLDVQVSYTLSDDNALHIDYRATTDTLCPVNLTNHAYFNLAGEGSSASVLDHALQLAANAYLPTDSGLIPTGEQKSVQGTSFDFRQAKQIGADFLQDADQQLAGGYDHAFILDTDRTDGVTPVATLIAPNADVTLTVATTKPALQVYSGNFLAGTHGASGTYQNYAGVALESEYFPDAPNHPEWQMGILAPDDIYQHQTVYRFEF